jgi:hypothetical protein
MKDYRVYKLTDADGRIMRAKNVEAPDDRAALNEAAADEDCPVCEVWQGAKKVGSIV